MDQDYLILLYIKPSLSAKIDAKGTQDYVTEAKRLRVLRVHGAPLTSPYRNEERRSSTRLTFVQVPDFARASAVEIDTERGANLDEKVPTGDELEERLVSGQLRQFNRREDRVFGSDSNNE